MRNVLQLLIVVGLVGFALLYGWNGIIGPALAWLFQAPQ
jgi:hypothetical protein